MKYLFILLFALITPTLSAQDDLSYLDSLGDKFAYKNKLEEKFLWGFNYTLGWSTIDGLDSFTVFTKPSVGACLMADYFPINWLGISVGVGHQMRGAGIITPDSYQAHGERDSTYRCRWRTNNINIPIHLVLRSPFTLANNNCKLSLAAGITPTTIFMAKRIFLSVEDGFHDVTSIKTNFISGFDIPLHFGLGVDINAGNSALFRLHLMAEFGMRNVYTNSSLNTTTGKNRLYGLEIHFVF